MTVLYLTRYDIIPLSVIVYVPVGDLYFEGLSLIFLPDRSMGMKGAGWLITCQHSPQPSTCL
jgi:hypothetical protein